MSVTCCPATAWHLMAELIGRRPANRPGHVVTSFVATPVRGGKYRVSFDLVKLPDPSVYTLSQESV